MPADEQIDHFCVQARNDATTERTNVRIDRIRRDDIGPSEIAEQLDEGAIGPGVVAGDIDKEILTRFATGLYKAMPESED
jgi:hypothetical protein